MLSGIIYLHKITDTRVGGVAKRNFSVFRRLCGDSTLKNAIIVTNMWTPNADENVTALEAEREQELATNDKFFKKALDNGARMARHYNSVESAHSIVRQILANKPQALQIQRELVDDRKKLAETGAGAVLQDYFQETSSAWRKEMDELRSRERDEIVELKAGHARLEEMLRRQAEAHRKETENLRETIRQLTNNLAETTEALQEVAKKLAHVSLQTEHLSAGAGDGLEKRISEVIKQAFSEVREFKRRQQWRGGVPRFAADISRTTSAPSAVRRASALPVQPEKRRETAPPSATPATQDTADADYSWGRSCVVQ